MKALTQNEIVLSGLYPSRDQAVKKFERLEKICAGLKAQHLDHESNEF